MNNNFLDLSLETLNNFNNDLEEVETHILSIGLKKIIKIIEKREEGKA